MPCCCVGGGADIAIPGMSCPAAGNAVSAAANGAASDILSIIFFVLEAVVRWGPGGPAGHVARRGGGVAGGVVRPRSILARTATGGGAAMMSRGVRSGDWGQHNGGTQPMQICAVVAGQWCGDLPAGITMAAAAAPS